jgi:hypothetical protein
VLNDAQEEKGRGVYAFVNTNKLRSFHFRSRSDAGFTKIEVEGKEAGRYPIEDPVKEVKDNARDRKM